MYLFSPMYCTKVIVSLWYKNCTIFVLLYFLFYKNLRRWEKMWGITNDNSGQRLPGDVKSSYQRTHSWCTDKAKKIRIIITITPKFLLFGQRFVIRSTKTRECMFGMIKYSLIIILTTNANKFKYSCKLIRTNIRLADHNVTKLSEKQ